MQRAWAWIGHVMVNNNCFDITILINFRSIMQLSVSSFLHDADAVLLAQVQSQLVHDHVPPASSYQAHRIQAPLLGDIRLMNEYQLPVAILDDQHALHSR